MTPPDLLSRGDAWKKVDECETGEHQDHLESPIFQWHRGLLLRVRDNQKILFSGVFSEDRCVDVSAHSEFAKKHLLRTNVDLFGFWKSSQDASAMLALVSHFVPQKSIVHCLCLWAEGALRSAHDIDDICGKTLEMVRSPYGDKKEIERLMGKIQARLNRFPIRCTPKNFYAYNGVKDVVLYDPQSCLANVTNAIRPNVSYSHSYLCNTLRNHIPFHEIATKIT